MPKINWNTVTRGQIDDIFIGVDQRLEKAIEKEILIEAGEILKAEIIAKAPEKTGRLKRAVQLGNVRLTDNRMVRAIRVGIASGPRANNDNIDAFYARFVEFGTIHASAKPFFRPAIISKRDEVRAHIARRLSEVIKT